MVVLNNTLFNTYLRGRERERERKMRETVRAANLNSERERESFYLYGCFFRTYFIK